MYVTVLDVNDNRPIFLQSSYEVSVPEDIPAASSIVQARGSLSPGPRGGRRGSPALWAPAPLLGAAGSPGRTFSLPTSGQFLWSRATCVLTCVLPCSFTNPGCGRRGGERKQKGKIRNSPQFCRG